MNVSRSAASSSVALCRISIILFVLSYTESVILFFLANFKSNRESKPCAFSFFLFALLEGFLACTAEDVKIRQQSFSLSEPSFLLAV